MTRRQTAESRCEHPFGWTAGAGMPLYAALAGVRYDRLFTDAGAIVEAYRRGRPLARELFGPDVHLTGPSWAGNSYGHINALGAPLSFPEDSEVAHQPIYGSLEEGICALKKEVDFTRQGLFPAYLELWEQLKKAFPEEKISFAGLKSEGPLTTGWALRGHEFFADALEYPDKVSEYLRLVTESVVKYNKLLRRINGLPEMDEKVGGVTDDVAAMVAPERWPELVMPHLERFYLAQTTGRRFAHIENLCERHLPYLDELGLHGYDPAVSPRLTPEQVRRGCRARFDWLLTEMDCREMTEAQVTKWVFESAAHADGLRVGVGRTAAEPAMARSIRAFISASKRVAALLAEGVPRAQLPARLDGQARHARVGKE